jgi:hypothetical protein
MAEAKPRGKGNTPRIAGCDAGEIERHDPESPRLDDEIGGFERFLGAAAAPDPKQMGQLHTGIAGREGIEVTGGVDERAEFRVAGGPCKGGLENARAPRGGWPADFGQCPARDIDISDARRQSSGAFLSRILKSVPKRGPREFWICVRSARVPMFAFYSPLSRYFSRLSPTRGMTAKQSVVIPVDVPG